MLASELNFFLKTNCVPIVHVQPEIEKTERSAEKKIDGRTSVTPWAPYFIFSRNKFHAKRPQLSIKIKIVPMTSCSGGGDPCSTQTTRVKYNQNR